MGLRSIIARLLVLLALAAALSSAADDDINPNAEARKALFAHRYEAAADLYTRLTREQPAAADAWYGLVRADLGAHHSREAYAAAEEALQKAPQSPGAQTAAGLAAWRKGDLPKAEGYFRAALRLNPDYPGALRGMASIYTAISKFRSARDMRLRAWSESPDDPELMLVHADTLKGPEHIAALEAVLALLDPASDEARSLRVHIANDRANGDRKTARLTSPYQNGSVKMFRLLNGPTRLRGMGVRVQLNGKQTVNLLLDTGASGISISPRMAEKAGLQAISGEASEARGIGDGKAQSAVAYLASEVRAGDVVFADYPIEVFRSAQSSDFDGLIGADVFRRFIVKIDFPQLAISLQTRPKDDENASDGPLDGGPPAPGFYRVFRFGDHLVLPTTINGKISALFMVDSGASTNLIDTDLAKEFTSTTEDPRVTVRGIQGKMNKASWADHVSLAFAGFRQDNPDLLSVSLEKLSDSMGVGFGGILGMPLLGNLAVTIDYREGTVRFEYRKP